MDKDELIRAFLLQLRCLRKARRGIKARTPLSLILRDRWAMPADTIAESEATTCDEDGQIRNKRQRVWNGGQGFQSRVALSYRAEPRTATGPPRPRLFPRALRSLAFPPAAASRRGDIRESRWSPSTRDGLNTLTDSAGLQREDLDLGPYGGTPDVTASASHVEWTPASALRGVSRAFPEARQGQLATSEGCERVL